MRLTFAGRKQVRTRDDVGDGKLQGVGISSGSKDKVRTDRKRPATASKLATLLDCNRFLPQGFVRAVRHRYPPPSKSSPKVLVNS